MAWFGNDPAAELDAKIEEATSESIPNGELDMATALEITDIIRSKKVPPKTAMRCLKKRLTKAYANPNILGSTLKLCDVCVKNGGAHFLAEFDSKEFMDYLVEFVFKVHYDTKSGAVAASEAKLAKGCQILQLVKEWSMYLGNSSPTSYVAKVYGSLSRQGYAFPAVDPQLAQSAANFVDSETPPDWIDGHECMISFEPFSMINRKHHCRACGGVFCQQHSSHSVPLPRFGITQPVRVCDNCYQIHRGPLDEPKAAKPPAAADEDEQLRRAIELSLQESAPAADAVPTPPPPPPPPPQPEPEMDDDMKAAIAASLAEYESQKPHEPREPVQQPQEQADPFADADPGSEFYSNIMSFPSYPSYAQPHGEPQGQVQGQFPGNNQGQVHGQFPGQNQGQSQNQHQRQSQPQSHHQPQNMYQPQSQPQNQPQNQPQPQHQGHQESSFVDLTEQEEEHINLFIKSINSIKDDPVKQMNVAYDQDLSDLHSKVVRLKPKLNRSIRSAIERYDFFLEMHNKINTITRLYDQFLENKLSQAYGKHSVSSPYRYDSAPAGYSSPTGYKPAQAGYEIPANQSPLNQIPAQQTGQMSAQGTGYQMPSQGTAYQMPPQGTGYQNPSGYKSAADYHVTHNSYQIPQAPGQAPHAPSQIPQGTGQISMQGTGPVAAQGTGQIQGNYSLPNYNQSLSPQETGACPVMTQPAPAYAPAQPVPPSQTGSKTYMPRKNSDAPYPVVNAPSYLPQPSLYNSHAENAAFPQAPSSPPADSDVSDAESVASRYPPLEERYEQEPASEMATGHASARFPSVTEIAAAEPKESFETEAKAKVYEPEPLIEL